MNIVISNFLKELDRKTKFDIGEPGERNVLETTGVFIVKTESVENVEKLLSARFGAKLQPINKGSIPCKPVYQFKKSEELF